MSCCQTEVEATAIVKGDTTSKGVSDNENHCNACHGEIPCPIVEAVRRSN